MAVKKELKRKGFKENKIFLGSNGVDTVYMDSIQIKEISYDGVFLGRLNRSKGIDDLIEIWKKVCESFPAMKLALIGRASDDEKVRLVDKIKKYNLFRNIDLLGFLENDEAFSILKSGKVFLFPSHEEGWGIAVSEAMACGVPVIAWNLPAYNDIYDDNIIQVEEHNIDLFAKKVIPLLNNKEKREAIGKRGREFIRKFSWDKVAKREYEIITS